MMSRENSTETSSRQDYDLYQGHSVQSALTAHFFGPNTGLNLAYMGFVEKHHAEAALPHSATDGQWEFAIEEFLMEIESGSFLLALYLQLTGERLGIDSDSHRGYLEAVAKYRVPEENVAVESHVSVFVRGRPVVVVGGTEVVRLSVAEVASDTDDEDGSIGSADGILALLWSEVGVHLEEFFGVDEMDVIGKEWLNLRIAFAYEVFGALYGVVDAAHHGLQITYIPVFGLHDALPIPLIDIEGMDVVKFFIATDGIHVGVESIAWLDVVLSEHDPFPLGKGMHYFRHLIIHILDREMYGTFHSAEVVVETESAKHEEGCGDTAQTECSGKILLEEVLYLLDGLFGLKGVEQLCIVLWESKHFMVDDCPSTPSTGSGTSSGNGISNIL